jgi:two-component system, NtrC family, nitrogen regulation response regulator GlnG
MTEALNAWVVDDDASMRWVIERALADDGIECRAFPTVAACRAAFAHARPDVLVSDLRMPGESGLELLAFVGDAHPGVPVIITTAHSDLDAAVDAYGGGAFEYLPKPFDLDELVALVRRAAAHAAPPDPPPAVPATGPDLVGDAPAMQPVFRAIGRLKRSDVAVLLSGETGTGKELVARALHRHSTRAAGPFVALNAAAIPADLIESELFGHERGAFTGAQQRRVGRFEQADGGTLFLDEIGDMPAAAQTRLLRVLAEREFYRVGGNQPIAVDVRVIAATHQPLQRLVDDGRFRSDLYHRLNVVHLELPPLRARPTDVPLLLAHFLATSADELGVERKRLEPAVEAWLTRLPWPGNVRELENLCRRLVVMAPGSAIHFDDLPEPLRPRSDARARLAAADWERQLAAWAEAQLASGTTGLAAKAQGAMERALTDAALAHAQGQRGEAARLLGWGRNTLARKLKRRKP